MEDWRNSAIVAVRIPRSANTDRADPDQRMTLGPADNPFLHIARPGLRMRRPSRFDIRMTVATVERLLGRGECATDEMLLEAVGWLDPPLLDKEGSELLCRELNPRANRAGRQPKKRLSLAGLAEQIETSDHPELTPLFRAAVMKRLRTRERYTDNDAAKPFAKPRDYERNLFLAALYRRVTVAFADGRCVAEIEPLGRVEMPSSDLPPAERNMALVKEILRQRMALHTPGPKRLFNILSERNSLKRTGVRTA